ncbi:MAG TPA: trigger factor [Acidobacteria bacterium]|nr:trigger factor [Acidobacteriota bacterium]
MSVVVSLQDVGPCRKQLTVEVPAPAVEAEEQRVLSEYSRKARIPGFRAGKVPVKLVRQRFGEDIGREVVERLLPRYWKQAQAEAAIDPLLPPEVEEVKERQPGEALTFVAVVEVRPQIELRNIRDFDLPNPSTEPGGMEVDDAVEDLRRRVAPWVPVERAAARGDLVTADLTRLSGAHGEEMAEGEAKTDRIDVELGDERVWEELTLALSGLSAGQEASFERRHEHPAAEEGGAPVVHVEKFRARVETVQERDLPPLDDDFAAQVSPDFKALSELREALTQRLRYNKIEHRREERERALIEQLRERHPLELPQGVVRREVESMVKDYAQSLAQRGVDVEHLQMDWNRVASDMMPLAERRVHSRLLLDAIAEAEAVHIGEEEFERALAVLARSQKTSTPQLRRALDEDGRLVTFRSQLRREKTIRHLLGEEPAAAGPAETAAT